MSTWVEWLTSTGSSAGWMMLQVSSRWLGPCRPDTQLHATASTISRSRCKVSGSWISWQLFMCTNMNKSHTYGPKWTELPQRSSASHSYGPMWWTSQTLAYPVRCDSRTTDIWLIMAWECGKTTIKPLYGGLVRWWWPWWADHALSLR